MTDLPDREEEARPRIRRAMVSLAIGGAFAALALGVMAWLAAGPTVKPSHAVVAPAEAPPNG